MIHSTSSIRLLVNTIIFTIEFKNDVIFSLRNGRFRVMERYKFFTHIVFMKKCFFDVNVVRVQSKGNFLLKVSLSALQFRFSGTSFLSTN